MKEPFLIVGAGIAGLATALSLRRRGLSVRIIDKRLGPAFEGAGLQIGPNGTRILEALGVKAALEAAAGRPEGIDVHSGHSGRFLTRLPLGAWIADRHKSPYWVLHRADLAHALAHALSATGTSIEYGVAGPIPHQGPIIGADGVWSDVRRTAFGDSEPAFSGRIALRALAPAHAADPMFRRSVTVWLAPKSHVVTYPIRAGREINIVVILPGTFVTPSWSIEVKRAEVAGMTSAFAYGLRCLFAAAETWRQWPIMKRQPLAHFSHGTTALIGDAAHPMAPFLAQGAVMALEDALAIADAVMAVPDDITRAFRDYSDRRRDRACRVVDAAEQNGRIYHLTGPAALARNTALVLAPPAHIMARYDWLYRGP